jgi:hypothetical protein
MSQARHLKKSLPAENKLKATTPLEGNWQVSHERVLLFNTEVQHTNDNFINIGFYCM